MKLKIDPIRHGSFESPKPFSIVFTDKNGPATYSNLVDERNAKSTLCQNCDTNPPTMAWVNDKDGLARNVHDPKELERAAFAFTLHRHDCIDVQWLCSRTPIANRDPNLSLYQECDDLVGGTPEHEDLWWHPLIEGIQTISLPESYSHDFGLDFWGMCDPFNIWLGSIDLQLGGTAFDYLNPVFVHEPVIKYGWEIPDFVGGSGGWLDGIPAKNEPLGSSTKRISSLDRPALDDFLGTFNLLNPCDLFIVAQVKDPIPNNRHGFIDYNHCCLDGITGMGDTFMDIYRGGDQYIGILLDYMPWAGDFGGSIEANAWADPAYPKPGTDIEPGRIGEDWKASEGAVVFWNLSEILNDYKNQGGFYDLRVRIEDASYDPTFLTYKGNWRRSSNVMDLLGFDTNTAKAGFVNDNPYDVLSSNPNLSDPNWKMVHYDGSGLNQDTDTTFIYNRSIDSPNNGKVYLDFFLLLESNGHPNPSDTIDVEFSSSETQFPSSSGETDKITMQLHMIREGDPILAELYGGFTNLDLVFNPQSICPLYYHARLEVSDGDPSSSECGILYVSHSDFMLNNNQKFDFAIAEGDDPLFTDPAVPSDPTSPAHAEYFCADYGTRRGVGCSTINPDEKRWYSYDEFITNGGIEVVTGKIIESTIYIATGQPEKCEVPVQSTADLVYINSHGQAFINDAYRALPFKQPEIYNPRAFSWQENAKSHVAYNWNGSLRSFSWGGVTYWSDYSTSGDGWGHYNDFWWHENLETRWLVLNTCNGLNGNGQWGTIKNWRNIIDSDTGYIRSVCGGQGKTHSWGTFSQRHGKILKRLFIKYGAGTYESGDYVYFYNNYYADGENSYSKDLNVAAWLEASVWCFLNHRRDAYKAEAFNHRAVDFVPPPPPNDGYFYWTVETTDGSTPGVKNKKQRFKIFRHPLLN
ncbi:hypothetical protein J7L05_12650 [bacterium]|nr:hypothetical protein [bacterium]